MWINNLVALPRAWDRHSVLDFVPQPFYSWVLNEETCLWEPPVPHPQDGKMYTWDEPTTSWKEFTPPA